MERIEPLVFTVNATNDTYELDFSKESVKFMAAQGFKVNENIMDLIATEGPSLWYYAFRKNHRKLSRGQTDALLSNEIGGLTPKIIERLVLLYNQALMSNNIIQDDEDLEKNARVTVKF